MSKEFKKMIKFGIELCENNNNLNIALIQEIDKLDKLILSDKESERIRLIRCDCDDVKLELKVFKKVKLPKFVPEDLDKRDHEIIKKIYRSEQVFLRSIISKGDY